MTDPIADLLTRIRNASNARHQTVVVPASRMKEAIVKILIGEGFLSQYVKEESKPQDRLKIFLAYREKKRPAIRKMTRISRPGGRVYKRWSEISPFLKGIGVTIFSTSKGILTDKQAVKAKVGGEVLCEVW